jgi:hypothetical protein
MISIYYNISGSTRSHTNNTQISIEDIIELWAVDTQIDSTELAAESLKIPGLHNKYYRIFLEERLRLKKMESEMKSLKLDKYEFYTLGPTKESQEKGWQLPAKGIILKQDIPMYMDADKDIIEMNLKVGLQQEKVELLETITKSITNRNFIIKNAIDWNRFVMGG